MWKFTSWTGDGSSTVYVTWTLRQTHTWDWKYRFVDQTENPNKEVLTHREETVKKGKITKNAKMRNCCQTCNLHTVITRPEWRCRQRAVDGWKKRAVESNILPHVTHTHFQLTTPSLFSLLQKARCPWSAQTEIQILLGYERNLT